MIPTRLGEFPTVPTLNDANKAMLVNMILPLPSARHRESAEQLISQLIEEALAPENIQLAQMKLPGLRKPFFSKGVRAAWVVPKNFVAKERDESLEMCFDLPRGSYGTMLIKHLQATIP